MYGIYKKGEEIARIFRFETGYLIGRYYIVYDKHIYSSGLPIMCFKTFRRAEMKLLIDGYERIDN